MLYRKDIQILRGLAVVFVVLFHLSLPGFNAGFLGVDVFFVISGFLMAVLYRNGNALEFYTRRARRLLPAYFVTILLTLIVASFFVLPIEQRQIIEQSLYATVFSSNLGFWQHSSYFDGAEFTPLLHLWSLGVEIQFYIIVPLIVFICRQNRYSLVAMLVLSLLACFAMTEIHPKTSFFITPFRIWEFLLGFCVAYHFSDGGRLRNRSAAPLLGIICLLVVLALPLLPIDGQVHSAFFGHPGMGALIATLATAGILTFGLPLAFETSRVGTALEVLGKYSYSIYLAHFPVIAIFLYEPFMGMQVAPDGVQDVLLLLVMITVASLLLFHLVEARSTRLYSVRRVAVTMSAVVALSFFTGMLVPKRFTEAELRIFDAWTDRSTIRCGRVFRMMNPLAPACELSEDGDYSGKVLLVGNSHADSIKVSFSKIATENNYRTLFAVDNTPIGNDKEIEDLIATAKSENVEFVFLHFSQNPDMHLAMDPFIRRLEEENINTALIMPTPRYDRDIPASLYENIAYDIDLPLLDIDTHNEINTDLLAYAEAKKSFFFSYFNPALTLCTPTCLLKDKEGYPLYYDKHHLTLTGGAYLEDFFREMFYELKRPNIDSYEYVASRNSRQERTIRFPALAR